MERGGVGGLRPFPFNMKSVSKLLAGLSLTCILCWPGRTSAQPSADSTVRQQLAKTLLSEGDEQQTNLTQLAETGSKLVHDVLTAWIRDGIFLYDAPSAGKIPVLLEDPPDAEGKARGIIIADGQFLKDD